MFKRKEKPGAKLQSRDKTAAMFNVNVRTVDQMIKRGELKAVRLGGRIMIPISVVNALIGE